MFKSATVKLTVWYAAIIIAISLLFSGLIYVVASREVNSRITYYLDQNPLLPNQKALQYLHDLQVQQAEHNLLAALFATNLCIWLAGGVGSYYLAKRTLQPIEEAHEAQSRFVSDASHELRTPLATMKVELEVALRDQNLAKDEMRELLTSNLEEVNTLSKLSQTLLELSQLEHNGIKRDKVALNKLLGTVKQRFSTPDRIHLNLPQHIINAYANQDSIEELLMILLDNALKYSPDDSDVKVGLSRHKNMASLTIINGGAGIAPEVLPHIFDRFYRADSSRTHTKKKGYGLGLSLAKKIVELHNGELSVTSAPNAETTFQVLLPIFSNTKAKTKERGVR